MRPTQLASMACAVFLTGCAYLGPTAYQPMASTGGYSNTKLADDLLQIEFRGNGYTSIGTARTYFLYRCAELTLENGFDYFELVEGNVANNAEGLGMGGTFSVATKPQILGVIKLHHGTRPEGSTRQFDARALLENLKPEIKRKS